MITYEQFKEIELRVAKILEATRIEGSEKLLKITVSLGEEMRVIMAGIGRRYTPEELIGREIVVVANLTPRALMGIESQGMLLAAETEEGPVLLMPDCEITPGAGIK
jgi:methionine--tRNA ligase beta chain